MPVRMKGQWAKLAIGALVLLNVVLMILLLWPRPPLIAGPSADPPSSFPTGAAGSPTPRPTPASTPTDDDRPETPPGRQATRLLAMNSERVGWRATITECGSPGTIEVTSNGGRGWRSTESGLTSVLRLKTFGKSAVFAVGADDRCRARFRTIEAPAGRWESDGGMLPEIWYREPKRRDVVHAPGGDRSRPCERGVADLAGLGSFSATALCQDGSLAITDSAGERWSPLRLNLDVQALNADDLGFVAAGRSSACSGVAVVEFNADGEAGSGNICAPVGAEGVDALGVAVRGDLLWVWADDRVITSTDGGRTW